MAKKVTGYIKLQVPAGAANPSPPIGPALGQRGVNIMEFCKAFNAATQELEKGMPIPTVITVYADRSFSFETKTPPASFLLKKAARISKSGRPSPASRPSGGSPAAAARDRRDEDEGSQRQRHRGRDEDHRRLRPRDGPRSDGGLTMAKLTKKQKPIAESVDTQKLYGVDEAIEPVKANATAKFDETIEVAMNLGVDPRHADQMVRGVVNAAGRHRQDGPGRGLRPGDKAEEAKKAGADVVGAEDLMETIQGGQIDFDRVIATPDMMGDRRPPRQGARPQGPDAEPEARHGHAERHQAVKDAKGGQVEFRVEKAGIIHAGIGKASFSKADLRRNFDAFVDAIVKAEAVGRQGQIRQEGRAELDHGPGRQGRRQRDRERLALEFGGGFR